MIRGTLFKDDKINRISSIVSSILILLGTIGFIIIPERFDSKIEEITKENDMYINIQKEVGQSIANTNIEITNYNLLNNQLKLLSFITKDVNDYNERKKATESTLIAACHEALNAANFAKLLSKDKYNSEYNRVESFKSRNQALDFCKYYLT